MNRIIAVDLDGTLVRSDMLVESLFLLLRIAPLKFLKVFFWLFLGKAYLKTKVANEVSHALDIKSLPYDQELLSWLKDQRSEGAYLVLATATDKRIASSIAEYLEIFDDVMGTEEINLSAEKKLAALTSEYGASGFEYVGNSKDDLPVWQSATTVHIVNPERSSRLRLLAESVDAPLAPQAAV